MAKIVCEIDTEAETAVVTIDGKDVGRVCSFSLYLYPDYRKPDQYDLSWNISVDNETGDDDFRSMTNYCSAAEMDKKRNEVARAQIADYFSKSGKSR